MLTPEFLVSFPQPIFDLFQVLEDEILADISRRIAKTGKITDTAQWQMERLSAILFTDEKIKKAISNTDKQAQKEIEKMLNEAAQTSFDAEVAIYHAANKNIRKLTDYSELEMLIESIIKQTQGELNNLTRTMGFVEQVNGQSRAVSLTAAYQKQLDLAQLSVSTGTLDYNTAIRTAVKRLADSGIRFIDYESGWTNHLDVAARRAVMTGVNQMSMRMTDFLADELGCEFFEVTAHAGARPSHREWQGEVYHRGGEKDGYPDLEETTGLGRVDGLCGANCRHSYHPFFPGISERAYNRKQLREIDPPSFTYQDKVYSTYEATQKQREMETAIRKTKRELIGYDSAGLKDDYTAAAVKLKRQRDTYKEFSYLADMAQQKELTQIYGFGHSQASKAAWANRKIEKSAQSAILNDKEESALLRYLSGESYVLNEKLRKGIALTESEKLLIDDLDLALLKMPTYQGTVTRDLFFIDADEMQKFTNQHYIGAVVDYPAFTSTTTLGSYQDDPEARLKILSQKGVDLRKYNREEGEILFSRNSKFKVIDIQVENNVKVYIMEEL